MKSRIALFLALLAMGAAGLAAAGSPPPAIHVEGRHFVDDAGNCVRLRGAMYSIHPFFSHGRWGGGRDDAAAGRAIEYFDRLSTALADRSQGSYVNMIRYTDDGHWSWDDAKWKAAKENWKAAGKEKEPPQFYACDYDMYRTNYLEKVLVPIVENTVKRGHYVIVRPAYNNPGDTTPFCEYHRHLEKEWRMMASHPRLQALAGKVIFELQNEPTQIFAPDGSKSDEAVRDYMQPLVELIRECGFTGPVIVPGWGYQSRFECLPNNPVRDPLKNMGYAVHVYPGWYNQRDETADAERFIANFLKQVPVVMDYPCVVTEVDWSPIKPGKGKTNEFGEFVPANWGSWGTGSTSLWGNAYFAVLEKFGNISTICGDGNIFFDVEEYLKSGKVKCWYDGESECCAHAFWKLYERWAKEKPQKPAALDRNLPRLLEGEEVPLKTIRHLLSRPFRMSTDGFELDICNFNDCHDFQYRAIAPVGRNSTYCHLFKAYERKVNGKTHYALKCFRNEQVLRLSGRDHGQGDSLCWAPNWEGFIQGSSRPDNKSKWSSGHDYGIEADYDGLWDIEEKDGGFTFRNVASGKYLGTKKSPHSSTPVVWQCTTRAVRKSQGARRAAPAGSRAGARPSRPQVRNPAIYADCPDVGLCCDGKYYYMVSTTMHLMPGAPIMRSGDAIHWQTIGYVFDRFDFPGHDEFSLGRTDGLTAYAGGQWASSLRYHDGKFYCYFIANGLGGFLYTAEKPEGPWKLHAREPFMHDASWLFDDDGKVWVFHGDGWLTLMNDSLTGVAPGWKNVRLFERGDETALLEGSSVFKKDGWYYVMMVSSYLPNHPRREVCYRSRSVTGPYEKKVIFETEFDCHGGVGQGAVVQGPDGSWHALVFQDRGGVGRTPCLLPVRWEDGWPMLGDELGHVPNDETRTYPDLRGITASDDFGAPTLGRRWQWNHNPDDSAWSLKARRGFLRLKANATAPSLFFAKNTLTQRMVGPECEATIKLDVSGMKDGDHAGLAAFQGDSAVAEVVVEGGRKKIVLSRQSVEFRNENGRYFEPGRVETQVFASAPLKGDAVYLRVRGNFERWQDWAVSGWSEDGRTWHWADSREQRVPMRFNTGKFFMGAKFAVFNYATKRPGGYVDVDGFYVRAEGHELPVARFRRFSLNGLKDDFTSAFLDEQWRELNPTNCVWWKSAALKGRGLAIDARPFALDEHGTAPSFLCRSVAARKFTAQIALSFNPRTREDFAGLAVYAKADAHYALGKMKDSSGRCVVALVKSEPSGKTIVATAPVKRDAALMLRAARSNSIIRFFWSLDGKKWTPIGGAEAGYLFDDTCLVGPYATSNALWGG